MVGNCVVKIGVLKGSIAFLFWNGGARLVGFEDFTRQSQPRPKIFKACFIPNVVEVVFPSS